MTFSGLTDEQQEIRKTVRAFVENELMPYETELLERERVGGDGQLTRDELFELQARGREFGLWGIDTPEEFGGVALDAAAQAIIHEQLGHVVFDFAFGGSAPDILYDCTEMQRERYLLPTIEGERRFCFALSEPEMGTDVRNIHTTAKRDGDEWVLNGEKMWINWASRADYAIAFAKTSAEGEPLGVTAFLVDRDMGYTAAPIPLMGSQTVASMSFQDVRVPNENVLGEVDNGFRVALKVINKSRAYVLPARCVGASTRLLAMGIEYAKARVTFGKPLAERENIQWMLAESELELRAARALITEAARCADLGIDYRYEAAAANLFTSRAAGRIADRVMQIHGALGYAKGLVIERFYRDFRAERIYEGSDEMLLSTLARGLISGALPPGGAD